MKRMKKVIKLAKKGKKLVKNELKLRNDLFGIICMVSDEI